MLQLILFQLPTAVFFGLKTVNNFDTWHLQQDRSSKPMELLIGLDLVQPQGDAFRERAKLILRGWGHVILSGVRSWYLFRSTMLATFELESRSARKVSCISIRSSTILPLQSSIIYTFLFELPYVDNTFNFPHFWHHHCIRSIIITIKYRSKVEKMPVAAQYLSHSNCLSGSQSLDSNMTIIWPLYDH